MNALKTAISTPTDHPAPAVARQEVRCAVRFPLALPVLLSTGNGDIAALSRNVSASGVLFALDRSLTAGQDIQFSLRMPGQVLARSTMFWFIAWTCGTLLFESNSILSCRHDR